MQYHTLTITNQLLNSISEIDEFRGTWAFLKNLTPEKLNSLRKTATIESVGSSTRIEGVKLSDAEVENLLSGIKTHAFDSRDEEEVAGYAELMNLIFDSYEEIPLTENYIKQLHGILLKYSSKDVRHKAEYKTLPNDVHAFNTEGKSIGVVFATTTPFDTPFAMQELLKWVNTAFAEKIHHPLLIIATFIVHFLAIHPFQDGNGRLSRALTTLLLLKNNYAYVPFASLESVIEINKEKYYLALRKLQVTLSTPNYNIEPWVTFFLDTLKAQKNNLLQKLEQAKASINLPRLSEQILELCKSQGRLTLSDAAHNIDANPRTIRDHIYRLVREGYLIKHGERKAVWYEIGGDMS
ncbi:Fic family protein [Candidatus Margulisiibacteriota bacterium]